MKVAHAVIDDWAVLYIDGRKIAATEGHRVPLRDAFDAVAKAFKDYDELDRKNLIEFEELYLDGTPFEKHMQEIGELFPDNLEEVRAHAVRN